MQEIPEPSELSTPKEPIINDVEEEGRKTKNEVLPEWVVEQSRSRGEWFSRIVDEASPELRDLLLTSSMVARAIQDVIIGAKPATDLVNNSFAPGLNELLQRVSTPMDTQSGNLRLVKLELPWHNEVFYWLINTPAMAVIADQNPDIFGKLKSIRWGTNEPPTITNAESFIEEALQNDYHRSYGLLMGFDREAVDFYNHLSNLDPSGIIFSRAQQQIAQNKKEMTIWKTYLYGKRTARVKLRPSVEKILDKTHQKVRDSLKREIESGDLLNPGNVFFDPATGEITQWDEIKKMWLDDNLIFVGGMGYGSPKKGPSASLRVYRQIREAANIEETVKKLKEKYQLKSP